MESFLWVFYWLLISVFFIGITVYLVMNIIALKKSTPDSFEGQPVEVDAVVAENTLTYFSTVKSASPQVSEKINYVTLKYVADGVAFTKEAKLIDVHQRLKAGDTVKLYYDSLDSGRALLADGSEKQSAVNGIKWAVGYYVILFIVGAFMFFGIANAVSE